MYFACMREKGRPTSRVGIESGGSPSTRSLAPAAPSGMAAALGARRLLCVHATARAHLHARLHAQLAAFASETAWRGFVLLPSLDGGGRKLIQELSAQFGLEAHHDERGAMVRKPPTTAPAPQHGECALLQACELYSAGPLALLLAKPVLRADQADRRAVVGARNVSRLVRSCADAGALHPMLDALETGTQCGALVAHPPSHNAAVSQCMTALTASGQPGAAVELYGASEAAGLVPSSRTLLELCVAARQHSEEAAAAAIDRVVDARASGVCLAPPAIDATYAAAACSRLSFARARFYAPPQASTACAAPPCTSRRSRSRIDARHFASCP